MLRVIAVLAALVGAQAQDCTAPNNVTYQFCGSVFNGEFNLYWNYLDQEQSLALVYEVPATGWHAFGFSDIDAPQGQRMPGANVVPGCIDFMIDQNNLTTADYNLGARNLAGIMPLGLQGLTAYESQVNDDVCWVRFARPFNGTPDLPEPQRIVNDAIRIVVAHGGPAFAQHSGQNRGSATINFADGSGVQPLEPMGPTDMPTEMPGEDDAASTLSMSAMVPALVAAVVALWQ